jgi:hypothetical protein
MSRTDSPALHLPLLGRRQLLAGLSGTLLLAGIPVLALGSRSSEQEFWVSAEGNAQGSFGLGWAGSGDGPSQKLSTGFRGHGVLQHPLRKKSVIFLSRRPGTRGLELDLASGEVIGEFSCKPGNHLFGHGCFSQNGRVFFTTEGDAKTTLGRIVVRDAKNYKVLDERSSYGVGPHDIRLLPGGKTLVVANGGILTRPKSGRQALNLTTMGSSLSYIDVTSGALVDEYRVTESKSSIRHLDVAADGSVAFAIQMQREAASHTRTVPLAGAHRMGVGSTLFKEPKQVVDRLRDYVGSVAISETSRVAGFTSPRGNLAVFWNIDDGEFVGYHRLRDVCGIAFSPRRNAFVLSNSLGELREIDAATVQERREHRVNLSGFRLDNHLLLMRSA